MLHTFVEMIGQFFGPVEPDRHPVAAPEAANAGADATPAVVTDLFADCLAHIAEGDIYSALIEERPDKAAFPPLRALSMMDHGRQFRCRSAAGVASVAADAEVHS